MVVFGTQHSDLSGLALRDITLGNFFYPQRVMREFKLLKQGQKFLAARRGYE